MIEKKLSRKEWELEQRKAFILDRAEELFAEHGFEDTSIAQIAESCELSSGSLYNFFPSKNEIYSELMMRKTSIIHEKIQEVIQKDIDALSKLKEIMEFQVNFFVMNDKFIKIYFNDIHRLELGLKTNLDPKATVFFEEGKKHGIELIKQAQKEGFLRDDLNPDKLVFLLLKITIAYLIFLTKSGEIEKLKDSVDDIFDIFLNGVSVKK